MRVFQPATASELGDWLAENGDQTSGGLLVTGSMPEWRGRGIPSLPRLAVVMDGLAGLEELRPADLTVKVGAGTRVGELGRRVWDEGLWLPFATELHDRSVGGLLAEAPPSAFDATYGPVRRHVLACTLAHYDGRLTRWGRGVMKNVAGYDIPRLVCGARSRLGVVTSVTLRLWPRPPVLRRFRLAVPRDRIPDLVDGVRLDGLIARSRASEPDLDVEATLAGGEPSVSRRSDLLLGRAREAGIEVDALERAEATANGKPKRPPTGAVYRVSFGLRYLSDGLDAVERGLAPGHFRSEVDSYPATGVARVRIDGLENASQRNAPAWLTAIAEAPRQARDTSMPFVGPTLRVERGGPAEHDVARRLRPAATRNFEDRLLAAIGGRETPWQADYL